MKQDVNVTNFIRLSARKESGKSAAAHAASDNSQPYQCEVVAVAPDSKSGLKNSFNVHKDFKDYRGLLDRLNVQAELSTNAGSTCLARFQGVRGGSHVLLVGTGLDKDGINKLGPTERLRRLGAVVAQKLSSEKIKNVLVHLDTFLIPASGLNADPEDAAYAFAEGMGLALYRFDRYFTKQASPSGSSALSVALASADSSKVSAYTKGIARAEAMLEGAYLARDLSNEPSNELHPEDFAARAKKLAATLGLKFRVLDEKAMAKENMGLLAGVGQGSVRPPRLIVLEYNPPKASKKTKTIAFVGKGVTFDSGGISIKPSAKMEDMKHDMSGAAAVMGAAVSAARLKLPVRIITAVAAAENMPSGDAIQPGNILVSRAGKTVEITNTDAEGRLVLADALDYIQDMNPDYVIDLATLTGAATITLGKTCSGLMGNDAAFNTLVENAAKASGERVWELPLFDEYFDDLKSEYADMRNSGDGPSHGTAKGAMFLKQFIRKGTRWVHLDIASVAYAVGFVPYNPKKSATGYGVRILVELAKKI